MKFKIGDLVVLIQDVDVFADGKIILKKGTYGKVTRAGRSDSNVYFRSLERSPFIDNKILLKLES